MATTITPPEELFTLGDLIVKARRDANMSQEELANAIGRARKTISRWERGPAEPRPKDLRKIAAETKAAWLVSDLSTLLEHMRRWMTTRPDQALPKAA